MGVSGLVDVYMLRTLSAPPPNHWGCNGLDEGPQTGAESQQDGGSVVQWFPGPRAGQEACSGWSYNLPEGAGASFAGTLDSLLSLGVHVTSGAQNAWGQL